MARVARIEPREAPALLKSGSPRAPRLTARLGYLHQSRSIESGCSTLLVWNATSDAVRGGSGCPFAPTMQHSGAADAGQAPVAVESGKSRHAKFRWACDHRLREAFNVLAYSSRHHNPWAADIYQRARARGAGHAHAARILGRAWSQVIWRLWHDHDTYDPTRHTARQRLATAHT